MSDATTVDHTPLSWAIASFGMVAKNRDERAARLLEEALEYAQSEGVSLDVVRKLTDRVYANQCGEPIAELRGVALTLASVLENVYGTQDYAQPFLALAEGELERVLTKPKEVWAERHAKKVTLGIADLSPVNEGPLCTLVAPAEPAHQGIPLAYARGVPSALMSIVEAVAIESDAIAANCAQAQEAAIQEWSPDAVLYHGGCHDGFGAAYLAARKWPGVELVPCSYENVGEQLSKLPRCDVLMVDMSIDTTHAAVADMSSLVILDHHKTAIDKVRISRPLPSLRDLGNASHIIYANLDMDKSGVRLLWDWLYPDALPPLWAQMIEDRDLWRFKFPASKAFHEALAMVPQTVEDWSRFLAEPCHNHVATGEMLLRRKSQLVDAACKAATVITLYTDGPDGKRVPLRGRAINAPYQLASDAGNELLNLHPTAAFSCVWSLLSDLKVSVSLRSEDSRSDVSVIAKRLGGGGHRNAAGCVLPNLAALMSTLEVIEA